VDFVDPRMRASASERRSENRPTLQRRYSNTKKDPVPEGRGESVVIVQNIFTCCYFYDSISFAMPDTFCSVWIHYVFGTKNREPWLVPAVRARLWPSFGAIAQQCDSMPKCRCPLVSRLWQQNCPASPDHSAALFLHPFFEKFLKLARRRLFKDLLTRNVRHAFLQPL